MNIYTIDSQLRRSQSFKENPQSDAIKDERQSKSAVIMRETKLNTNKKDENVNDIPMVKINCENNKDDEHTEDEININTKVRITEKMRTLITAFAKRGETVKSKISVPIRKESIDLDDEEISSESTFSAMYEDEWIQNMDITRTTQLKKSVCAEFWHKLKHHELGTFEPQSSIYVSWLLIVSLAFVYNAVIIFVRSIFQCETDSNRHLYFICDYICDCIYIMDMIWFKMRLRYVYDGQWIADPIMTRKNYIKRNCFKIDLLSLLPLDFVCIKYGWDKPLLRLLRLPRLLKVQIFWEFFNRVDSIAKSPYFIRIIHTLIYKMYLIHLSACAYYIVSWYEGFGSTPWTYNNVGNAYLRCFYFAFRTATSIGGRMPKPTNDLERVYMNISWLMGVFVFALLIGQIREIIANATADETLYRQIVNQTVRYMRNLNLPHNVQKRVRLWLHFTWEQQKTFDEHQILKMLPRKMRTDLSLSVHYNTLSKVQLFKDCDRTVMRDLVIKLKSILFLPGDYICRKGDIGKEMYIVSSGHVYVMGGDDGNTVLATLSEGAVFGEIAILGIPGNTRRTADVQSLGFSNLFVLSKADLWDTLKHYPEYQTILCKKVKHLMKRREMGKSDDDTLSDEIDAECIIDTETHQRPVTPKLLQTVMQMVSPKSKIGEYFIRSQSSSFTRSSFSLTPTPLTSDPTLLSPTPIPSTSVESNQSSATNSTLSLNESESIIPGQCDVSLMDSEYLDTRVINNIVLNENSILTLEEFDTSSSYL